MQAKIKFGLISKGLLAAATLVGTAFGGVSNVVISITASNENGTSTWELTADELGLGNFGETDEFNYKSNGSVELVDKYTNQVVATLENVSLYLKGDPAVGLSFAVQAGSATTLFTISSAINDFVDITSPDGLASAGVTLVDSNGNGAKIDGMFGGKIYRAEYDALVIGTGTTFDELVSSFATVGGDRSETSSENHPFESDFAASASTMSSQFKFELSPFDLASGTSYYEIVPEPASLALLGLGVLLFARRTR